MSQKGECYSADRGALKIREEDFTYPPPQVSENLNCLASLEYKVLRIFAFFRFGFVVNIWTSVVVNRGACLVAVIFRYSLRSR
jgi:hypothetical protein